MRKRYNPEEREKFAEFMQDLIGRRYFIVHGSYSSSEVSLKQLLLKRTAGEVNYMIERKILIGPKITWSYIIKYACHVRKQKLQDPEYRKYWNEAHCVTIDAFTDMVKERAKDEVYVSSEVRRLNEARKKKMRRDSRFRKYSIALNRQKLLKARKAFDHLIENDEAFQKEHRARQQAAVRARKAQINHDRRMEELGRIIQAEGIDTSAMRPTNFARYIREAHSHLLEYYPKGFEYACCRDYRQLRRPMSRKKADVCIFFNMQN